MVYYMFWKIYIVLSQVEKIDRNITSKSWLKKIGLLSFFLFLKEESNKDRIK